MPKKHRATGVYTYTTAQGLQDWEDFQEWRRSRDTSATSSTTPADAISSAASGIKSMTPAKAEDAVLKELVDKLSWAVGSTFKLPYGRRSGIREWAYRQAQSILERWEAISQ